MIVAILISVHLLADFLFQSSAVLERKRQKRKFLFLHCSIYFVVFEILFFILFQCEKAFLLGVIISILHFLINLIKNKLEKQSFYITEGKKRGLSTQISKLLGVSRQSVEKSIKIGDIYELRNLTIAVLKAMDNI